MESGQERLTGPGLVPEHTGRESLEDSLIRILKLGGEDLAAARAHAAGKGSSLPEALVALRIAGEAEVARAVAETAGLPYLAEIRATEIVDAVVRPVPIQFAKRFRIVPLREDGEAVLIAVADLAGLDAVHNLHVLFQRPVKPCVSPVSQVMQAIDRVYERSSERADDIMEGLADVGLDALAHEVEEPRDLLDASDEAPMIRLVNGIFFQAVKDRASDIHVEPFERELQVRYRIDGVLYPVLTPPKALQAPLTSRIKILAGLDIAEKRLPQDGRIRIKLAGKDVDVRVSVLPTAFGERVVMRLLDKTSVLLDLEDLGLEGERLERFRAVIRRPHGILLVTGPTGSGKTTTLYAALSRINSPAVNIITVEDPIEYQIQGIGQIHVNPKIDLTFAAGLRSILRQDPDVIMVGEIRDVETAQIAIQASLTGHLVFSTLHTNDAAGAFTRLVDMGVEPFLVSSSVLGVLAQRLVRVLCRSCREPYPAPAETLRSLGIDPALLPDGVLYRPAGCPHCMHTGYRGRTGIYELLNVSDGVRDLLMRNADAAGIKEAARRQGMLTLREDGVRKICLGITSVEEVLRVTQDDLL